MGAFSCAYSSWLQAERAISYRDTCVGQLVVGGLNVVQIEILKSENCGSV